MRISHSFWVLTSFTLALGCSSSDPPPEAAASSAGAGSPAVHASAAATNAGSPTDLDAAAPLTDDELDRLLDALEQQLDKK